MWAPIHMRKVFVGGIDYTTTDDSLKEHFSTWGEVVDAVVMKDPATNRSVEMNCCGCCYCIF